MFGSAAMMTFHGTDAKPISWGKAIMILTYAFLWLISFTCSFVVCMAVIIHMDMNFTVFMIWSLMFVFAFFSGLTGWFNRTTTYSVHGVSGVLIFFIGSFIFTIVIGFNVYICRKFGIFKRLKELWIDLRGH
jgi:hypothetical protein